ncbi:unnamed protein product [Schistocephalus solidus]|uniref:Sodium:calcium symporter n=1 Tax=Schistocephalus solidus TaxID=70667 RepID=A0A183T077_SCHSO|nr:unnamed protein product [Schistocephalus solidus]
MALTLHWSDYFVFVLSLFAYFLVGVYFRWSTQINNLLKRCLGRPMKEVKPQTAKEIFLANRQLSVLPVMASTAASFFSAATLLGNHLEIYLYGLPLMSSVLAQVVLLPLVSEFYMPVLYKLKLFSINQGGLKGIVWTDLIQLLIMFIGMLCILIFGVSAVGGPATVWNTALKDGKIDGLSQDDWRWKGTQVAGAARAITRRASTPGSNPTEWAILLNLPIFIVFAVLHVAIGLVSYVYFRGCDPKLSGELPRYEMLLPFLTLKLFANIPLLRGLFLSAIFAPTLRFVRHIYIFFMR